MTMPLVSCIMPTYNRRIFVVKAIEYFLRQEYPNKQLVIVDDGTDPVKDLVPDQHQFIYVRLNQRMALGEKRNIAIENSVADIILHWDDDDWYAANRIEYQVNALINEDSAICGLGSGLYYDIGEDKFWRCEENLHNTLFYAAIIGGSICYRKSLWHTLGKFHPHCTLAEDSYFLRKLSGQGKNIQKLPNRNTFIYIRHSSNTWPFKCGQFLKPMEWIALDDIQSVMPDKDLEFYRNMKLRPQVA